MANNIAARIRKLETEVSILERKREEEVSKALTMISKLTPSDIDLLSQVVPEISIISQFTKDDLMNKSSCRDLVSKAVNTLESYLEERLAFYEGKLDE